MAFDVDTTVAMAKTLSTLISGTDDAVIAAVVEQQALPIIRMRMLTATGSDGRHALYAVLGDLSDATTSAAAEDIIDVLIDEPTLSLALRSIASALTCAILIVSQLGIIESQQRGAERMEKRALDDLDRLVRSPLLKSAATAVSERVAAGAGHDMFFFDGTSTEAGDLVYAFDGGDDVVVTLADGATALEAATAFSDSVAADVAVNRVLAAVRPSSRITINGTPQTAPGVELVPLKVETSVAAIVVTIKSVPTGLLFGVAPKSGITEALFDTETKSVVLAPRIAAATATIIDPSVAAENTGTPLQPTYVPSTSLAKIIAKMGKR